MNDKLVIRAATHYRNWIQRHSLEPLTEQTQTIIFNLTNANQKIHQMREWSARFLKGMAPRIQVEIGKERVRHIGIMNRQVYATISEEMIQDLKDIIVRNVNNCLALMQAMTSEEASYVPSTKEAIQELTVINNEWSEVTYKQGILSVNIGNVSLTDGIEEVDLGDFILCLNIDDPTGPKLKVIAVNPIKGSMGYYHPHIKDESLCEGDGKDIMRDALRHGRLEDYFRIAESIVRTYNEDSPYEPLQDWYNPDRENQICCDRCDDWICIDEMYCCDECNVNFCYECGTINECKQCDQCCCEKCLSACIDCGQSICGSCRDNCHDCKGTYCVNCMSICIDCHIYHCPGCNTSCLKCANRVCYECQKECLFCGDIYCHNCIDMTCEQCCQHSCYNCINTCSSCEKQMCIDCFDESCEHCGISICKPCTIDHNCLLRETSN